MAKVDEMEVCVTRDGCTTVSYKFNQNPLRRVGATVVKNTLATMGMRKQRR